ncbi:signal peptidase I [Flavobacterium sp. DGU11]|uniref:Signal peptidase I n=1 Tax=Flavobacterium arundinis TaxID=3139143 RepID=A0ABU9HU25_9FLAO
MTLLQWFIFFLAVQVIHFAGTWKLYEKAGRKRWEAAVPVYNAVVLMQIINRPRWWVILLFIPVVNLIMFPVVWVQTLRAFGKRSSTDTILGIVTLGLYVYAINYNDKVTYTPEGDEERKDSTVGSLLFAIVVATIVHTYVMQPFTIPSPSLEKTLLVGDFLFVSKLHYGARTPMTPIAAPMVHDTIPFINVKSYSKWPQLPSFRFPGFEKVEKNDIVVFNWPADTVVKFRDQSRVGVRKPVDKKSNYVKRCVGTPGDVLSIKDGVVMIGSKPLQLNDRARLQHQYILTTVDGGMFDSNYLINDLKINRSDFDFDTSRNIYLFRALTGENAEILKNNPKVKTIEKRVFATDPANTDTSIFPHSKPGWTVDNMGPVYIPEEGKKVDLTNETLPFYKMIITEYEKNTLEVIGGQIVINGQPATSYTFKQNYYWMMGDNRHNSEDSRFWGFVPEDHIVGKPVFVWMSLDQNQSWGNISKKVRWERMFTTVGGDDEPVSYFKYFLAALVLWIGFSFFRKKRNAEKA